MINYIVLLTCDFAECKIDTTRHGFNKQREAIPSTMPTRCPPFHPSKPLLGPNSQAFGVVDGLLDVLFCAANSKFPLLLRRVSSCRLTASRATPRIRPWIMDHRQQYPNRKPKATKQQGDNQVWGVIHWSNHASMQCRLTAAIAPQLRLFSVGHCGH